MEVVGELVEEARGQAQPSDALDVGPPVLRPQIAHLPQWLGFKSRLSERFT